ncbi:hypothetical protein CI109_103943 [Kwoniella shandongensis]|uniref:Mitochondrial zinc maintenance protein 1, mitochondrial n=1 Tax=Kwoniella shandongensis TaxID=1734106 RepID=A0A5M6BT81_9TREE|nr:uncharacterized protein CI109_005603 [Kwoniella shandongensis]KAA5526007.1 hypothetical protein CI109_005603 [Kwoniella shandongensis]
MPLKSGPGPTLQHFILRAELLQAYRKAVRATRPLPDSHTRRETLDFLRSDLERLRFEYELDKIRSHLSHFNKTLKQMTPSLNLTGLTISGEGAKLIGQKRRNNTF